MLRRSGGCNPSPCGAREIAVILESGDARGHRLARVSLIISTQHVFFYEPLVSHPSSGGQGSPSANIGSERTGRDRKRRGSVDGVPFVPDADSAATV